MMLLGRSMRVLVALSTTTLYHTTTIYSHNDAQTFYRECWWRAGGVLAGEMLVVCTGMLAGMLPEAH